MKYVITGGAGFIGSHIAEYLSKNHEVIVVDNLFSGKKENIADIPVTFENVSITDLPSLKRICEGADGIFHQAAITSVPRSVQNPLPTHEINCTGMINTLLAAKETGVKSIVFASSSSVYGDTPTLPKVEDMPPVPLSPYGVTKLTGEQYCRVFSELYGIRTVALRYFNVFGPRQDPNSDYAAVIPKFIHRISRKESPVIYGDGTQTRDFTFVKDVVQANVKAMESNAQGVFNIACQKQINLKDLAEMIMDIVGVNVPIVYDPPRPGDIHDSLADISLARDTFGYNPEYSMREGLMETVKWLINQ